MRTYLFTIISVGICFGIIYGITLGKKELSTKYKDDIPENTIRALSIICSLIITFVNISMRTVVRRFSLMEKHETYTAYNLSVAFKLTLGRFVNTSIVPIVANIALDEWFNNGGLVSIFFYIMLSISFVDPFLYYFDTSYVLRLVKRWLARRKGKESVMN